MTHSDYFENNLNRTLCCHCLLFIIFELLKQNLCSTIPSCVAHTFMSFDLPLVCFCGLCIKSASVLSSSAWSSYYIPSLFVILWCHEIKVLLNDSLKLHFIMAVCAYQHPRSTNHWWGMLSDVAIINIHLGMVLLRGSFRWSSVHLYQFPLD